MTSNLELEMFMFSYSFLNLPITSIAEAVLYYGDYIL